VGGTATFTIVNHAAPDTEDAASVTMGATGKTTYTATRPLDFTNSGAFLYKSNKSNIYGFADQYIWFC